MNQQIGLALEDRDVRAKLEQGGAVEVVGGTPESFGTLVKSETARWKAVIERGHVTID